MAPIGADGDDEALVATMAASTVVVDRDVDDCEAPGTNTPDCVGISDTDTPPSVVVPSFGGSVCASIADTVVSIVVRMVDVVVVVCGAIVVGDAAVVSPVPAGTAVVGGPAVVGFIVVVVGAWVVGQGDSWQLFPHDELQ